MTAGCICGSDLWPYRGENDITPGDTIGHEMIGVIEEVGSEVSAFKPGDFVVAPFCHCDNTCAHCRAGAHSACVNLGVTTGGQGEYAKVTQAEGSLVKTDGMPDASLLPSLLTLSDVLPDGVALRGRPRECSPETPSWWSATARSACAVSWPRPSWGPSG